MKLFLISILLLVVGIVGCGKDTKATTKHDDLIKCRMIETKKQQCENHHVKCVISYAYYNQRVWCRLK